jgi:hypothetical protein
LYFFVSGNFHEYFIVISLLSFHSENNPTKITTLGTLTHKDPSTHDAYKYAYNKDEDSKEVFQQLQGQVCVEEGNNKDDYHI